MKTRWTLLLAAVLSVATVATPAEAASSNPLLVNGLGGDMRITLSLPLGCGNVDHTTGIAGGVLAVTPAEGIDAGGGARSFSLTRASVGFAPFIISRSCFGQGVTNHYSRVAVRLAQAVTFTAHPSSPGIYPVAISKDNVRVYHDIIVNGSAESGYSQPIQDVTGTLDLAHGTVQLGVVFGVKVHLQGGCVPLVGCVVNEDRTAIVTASLGGRITFPDSDGDGIPDKDDTCRLFANPEQRPVATPVIQADPNLILASCAHRIRPPFSADLCDAVVLDVTSNEPPTYPPGRTIVTWTAVDAQGRTASDTEVVQVADTTRPVFTSLPGDIALSDCGPANLGLPTATDDCGGSPTFTNNAPARFLAGRKVVTWTAADLAGNRATATQSVTVTDTVAPAVICKPAPALVLDPSPGFFKVAGSDQCGAPIFSLGPYALANGMTIHITPTTRPGVTFVKVVNGVPYFMVGPDEAVVTATDRSGNVASASCSSSR